MIRWLDRHAIAIWVVLAAADLGYGWWSVRQAARRERIWEAATHGQSA